MTKEIQKGTLWFAGLVSVFLLFLSASVLSASAETARKTVEEPTASQKVFWNILANEWQVAEPGKAVQKYTGLQKANDGTIRLIENGKQVSGFTGIVKSGETQWYVADGKVQSSVSGIVDISGDSWLVENGAIVPKSGSYSYNKGTYTLNSGKVTGVRFPVTAVNQMPKYPTGCEGAAATTLLRYYGYNVTLDEMISAIPRENITVKNGKRYGPSIYEKFVGDPRGGYTSKNPGYGAFAPVVTKSMNQVIASHGGGKTAKDITGSTVTDLYRNLRNGSPQIVWATYNMNQPTTVNSWYINSTGKYFEYPRGTHVMVLTGYDANNVYIADPYGASNKTFSRSTFNSRYKLLGQQAIILT